MTRHNLVLTLPLLVLYVFWQHGRKAGWWAFVACPAPILVLHVVYWPNILQLWTIWLPSRLTPFLGLRLPAAGLLPGDPSGISPPGETFPRLPLSIFSLLGFIACLFLWPRQGEWKSKGQQRAAVFVAVLFVVQTPPAFMGHAGFQRSGPDMQVLLHALPDFLRYHRLAAGRNYLSILEKEDFETSRSRNHPLCDSPFSRAGIAVFDRLALAAQRQISSFSPVGWTRASRCPFITLWDILANKFHLDYWTSRLCAHPAGSIFGIILLVLAIVPFKAWQNKILPAAIPLDLSWLPCWLWGCGFRHSWAVSYRQDGLCHANIPAAYTQIGKTLAEYIPPGSQVYWEARTAVPFILYPRDFH